MKRINIFFPLGLLLFSLTFCEKENSEPENTPDNSQEYEFKYIDTVSIGYLTNELKATNFDLIEEIPLMLYCQPLLFTNDSIKENNKSMANVTITMDIESSFYRTADFIYQSEWDITISLISEEPLCYLTDLQDTSYHVAINSINLSPSLIFGEFEFNTQAMKGNYISGHVGYLMEFGEDLAKILSAEDFSDVTIFSEDYDGNVKELVLEELGNELYKSKSITYNATFPVSLGFLSDVDNYPFKPSSYEGIDNCTTNRNFVLTVLK